jgi:hypothetical protein
MQFDRNAPNTPASIEGIAKKAVMIAGGNGYRR